MASPSAGEQQIAFPGTTPAFERAAAPHPSGERFGGVARRVQTPLGRLALWLGLQGLPRLIGLLIAVWAVGAGIDLRLWTFDTTGPVRFTGDIQNGLNQGGMVLKGTRLPVVKGQRMPLDAVLRAWVGRYDKVLESGRDGRYSLDYTPARLLVMTLWAREVWAERGESWRYRDGMARPLMWVNVGCALASAGAMFLLVRHWVRRSRPAGSEPENSGWMDRLVRAHRGWVVGLVCALLVWFNAAAVVNAHAFPQWDIWLMPFFLLACYVGSLRAWTWAGLLLVLGAMLKGQVLLVAAPLVLWPMVDGVLSWRGGRGVLTGLTGLLRMGVGLAAGVAVVTWPWLVRQTAAWWWIGACVLAVLLLAAVAWGLVGKSNSPSPQRGRRPVRCAAVGLASVVAFAMLLLPVLAGHVAWLGRALDVGANDPAAWGTLALCAALAGVVVASVLWLGRLRWRPRATGLATVLLGVVAGGVLFSGAQLGGTWSWYVIGFKFPTEHYLSPAMGPTANGPALLQARYGWNLKDPMVQLPDWATSTLAPSKPGPDEDSPGTWTLQTTLRVAYFASLAPIILMLGVHARRGSPRVLLCFAAPWVLMFALMPQMHERYLLWGAVATAGGLAVGLGWGLMHLAVTLVALACVGLQVLYQNDRFWPEAMRFFQGMVPDAGWAVLLMAAVYLYGCLSPGRGGGKRVPTPPREPTVRAPTAIS